MIRNSMVSLTALSLLIMVWACSDKTPAPSETPQAGYPSLWESFDPKLQAAIETRFRQEARPQFWQLVKAKKAGIVVVDITDDKQPKVAGYNPDVMLYAASLPKIAIALGAFVKIEQGRMALDQETKNLLTSMIRKSSNKAATAVLAKVGIEDLADILQSDRYRLYDPQHNGGLWVGRDYSGGPVWKTDPLHGISHGATAMQTARFYYLAVTGRLVKEEYRAELREVFSDPAIAHKFVKGLKLANPDAEVYRKSGTWKSFHADSGVVVTDKYRYILVALAEHPDAGEGMVNLVQIVDDVVGGFH